MAPENKTTQPLMRPGLGMPDILAASGPQTGGPKLISPADGAGYRMSPGADCPVIIHVPHAGLGWPDDGTAMPTRPDLWDEMKLLADRDVDEIADMAAVLIAGRCNAARKKREPKHAPALFVNQISRVAMDPERFDDDSEEMNQVGMGVVYERTHDGQPLYEAGLSAADIETRKALWYLPYSQALSDLVDAALVRHGSCLILDLHSYPTTPLPYELHKADDRPEICLGYEPFHDPGIERAEKIFTAHGYHTARNQPFQGSYMPSIHWHKNPAVKSLMIEIRKDQYLNSDGTNLERVTRLADTIADFTQNWLAQNQATAFA